ncbi:MAG TPA: NAD-dependent epimerase/dehydratase family protein, partial [Parvularculaceae bacterium]|nr:NAD-dependent epimerase/dehydratase family protein [Parvularculaceae bacterium]
MRVLILGGYGLIGGEILRALAAAGIEIVGLGRNAALGRRLFPGARWIGADLRRLSTPEAWESILTRVDAIVNAAGALQSGP